MFMVMNTDVFLEQWSSMTQRNETYQVLDTQAVLYNDPLMMKWKT